MSDDSEYVPPPAVPTELNSRAGVAYIADVAARALDAYDAVHLFLLERLWRTPELIEMRDQLVLDKLPELGQELLRLATAFEQVAGWWVADRPPAFAPACVSVVDAIIEASAYLMACFGADNRIGPAFDRRQQELFPPAPDESYVPYREMTFEESRVRAQLGATLSGKLIIPPHHGVAHLRCECAELLRRGFPAVKCRLEPRRFSFRDVMQLARAAANCRIEGEPEPIGSGPSWHPNAKVLLCGERVVRDYRGNKAAPNQWTILDALQESGWPSAPVLIDLKAEALDDTITSFNKSVAPGTIRLKRCGGGVGWHLGEESSLDRS